MRLLQWFLPLLAGLPFISARRNISVDEAMLGVPDCVRNCFTAAIAGSYCESTPTANCICFNGDLDMQMGMCVEEVCNIRDALKLMNATMTFCGARIRQTSAAMHMINVVVFVLSIFCTFLRVIFKVIYCLDDLGRDDYATVATLAAHAASMTIFYVMMLPNGFGRDMWTVNFDEVTELVHGLFLLEVLYFLEIALLKLTLLFFFLRIFPRPLTRRLLWATVAWVLAFGLTFVMLAVFQCRPVSAFWLMWFTDPSERCIQDIKIALSNSGLGISTDVWMLALPLYEIFHLQLSWRKKFSVAIMFCFGTSVTIVSILRIRSFFYLKSLPNPTWDSVQFIGWSFLEISIGIICCCLPTLRVIALRLFRKKSGTTQGASDRREASKTHLSRANGSQFAAISCTRTFDVQHGDNDDEFIMEMNALKFRDHKGGVGHVTTVTGHTTTIVSTEGTV